MTAPEDIHGGGAGDEILAAEYVIGVLSAESRRAVEARMAGDASFARRVERWQSDLSSFNEDYAELAPGRGVYSSIEARLFAAPQTAFASPSAGWWNSLALWRGLTLGASLVAVVAIVSAALLVPRQSGTSTLTAELSAPNDAISMLASYDTASGTMRLVPVAAAAQQKKSLELWLVPNSGSTISLGVFSQGADGRLVVPKQMRDRITDGTTFAISVEPFGGSPTGQATGPVVAVGKAHGQK